MSKPFEIVLNSETILLMYKERDYAFEGSEFLGASKDIKNMYLYLGLTRALEYFIRVNTINNDECVDLDSLGNLGTGLEMKLLDLMTTKNIKELGYDNIDEVIQQISDQLVEKYTLSMKGMIASGN